MHSIDFKSLSVFGLGQTYSWEGYRASAFPASPLDAFHPLSTRNTGHHPALDVEPRPQPLCMAGTCANAKNRHPSLVLCRPRLSRRNPLT